MDINIDTDSTQESPLSYLIPHAPFKQTKSLNI